MDPLEELNSSEEWTSEDASCPSEEEAEESEGKEGSLEQEQRLSPSSIRGIDILLFFMALPPAAAKKTIYPQKIFRRGHSGKQAIFPEGKNAFLGENKVVFDPFSEAKQEFIAGGGELDIFLRRKRHARRVAVD